VDVLKRLRKNLIYLLLIISNYAGAYGTTMRGGEVYSIGAAQPRQIGGAGIGSTMPAMPHPARRTISRSSGKYAAGYATGNTVGSRSAYPVYMGDSRQKRVVSYGGTGSMSTSIGGGGYSKATASMVSAGGVSGGMSAAGTGVQVMSIRQAKGQDATSRSIGGSVDGIQTESAIAYTAERASVGKRFGAPTMGGGGGESDDEWGPYDRDLWNTFHEAWLYGEGEDGVNYYDEQKLYELWLQYLAEHPGMMPGQGNTGYTWDDLITFLRNNTANGTGYSMLPIGDGVWAMIAMVTGYIIWRRKKVRYFKIMHKDE